MNTMGTLVAQTTIMLRSRYAAPTTMNSVPVENRRRRRGTSAIAGSSLAAMQKIATPYIDVSPPTLTTMSMRYTLRQLHAMNATINPARTINRTRSRRISRNAPSRSSSWRPFAPCEALSSPGTSPAVAPKAPPAVAPKASPAGTSTTVPAAVAMPSAESHAAGALPVEPSVWSAWERGSFACTAPALTGASHVGMDASTASSTTPDRTNRPARTPGDDSSTSLLSPTAPTA